MQNDFNADPDINVELNILRQGESRTINGNLLTLPIGGGLLYVQPVYIQSTGSTSFPLLQRVLVAFGTDLLARLKAIDASRPNIPIPKGPVPTSMKGMRGNMRGR